MRKASGASCASASDASEASASSFDALFSALEGEGEQTQLSEADARQPPTRAPISYIAPAMPRDPLEPTKGELIELPNAPHSPEPDDVLRAILDSDLPYSRARQRLLKEFERRYVTRALEKHGGSVSKAAAASGLAHRYFQVIKARQR
jgi:hypothetical protein